MAPAGPVGSFGGVSGAGTAAARPIGKGPLGPAGEPMTGCRLRGDSICNNKPYHVQGQLGRGPDQYDRANHPRSAISSLMPSQCGRKQTQSWHRACCASLKVRVDTSLFALVSGT